MATAAEVTDVDAERLGSGGLELPPGSDRERTCMGVKLSRRCCTALIACDAGGDGFDSRGGDGLGASSRIGGSGVVWSSRWVAPRGGDCDASDDTLGGREGAVCRRGPDGDTVRNDDGAQRQQRHDGRGGSTLPHARQPLDVTATGQQGRQATWDIK